MEMLDRRWPRPRPAHALDDSLPLLEAVLHGEVETFPADLRIVGSLAQIQQTARALAAQGVRPRSGKARPATPTRPDDPAPTLHIVPAPEPEPTSDLINVLFPALHLLFVGPTRSGKTSIVHELALQWAADGQRVLVCDPDAAPGLWTGCDVCGGGDDWLAISETLDRCSAEITHRRQLRASGQRRTFLPLYLVLCEYGEIVQQCEQARPVVEMALRRGGKLNVHLVLDLQDKLVKTLGMEGQSALRQNFTYVVSVQRTGSQRTAHITAHDSGSSFTLPVPTLPDLDQLVALACGEATILHTGGDDDRVA
jgi:hypothetical protein